MHETMSANTPPSYSPDCIHCNLRRMPGCVHCYALGATGACESHRTPCGAHAVPEADAPMPVVADAPPPGEPMHDSPAHADSFLADLYTGGPEEAAKRRREYDAECVLVGGKRVHPRQAREEFELSLKQLTECLRADRATCLERAVGNARRLQEHGALTDDKQALKDKLAAAALAHKSPLTEHKIRKVIEATWPKPAPSASSRAADPTAGLTPEEQESFSRCFGGTPAERMAILRTVPMAHQVPASLAIRPNWVCWRKVPDANNPLKFRKPPFSPLSGKAIGAVEKYAAEFTYFAYARAAAVRRKMTGLGYVLRRSEGILGIDFDNCFKDGVLNADVQDWLKFFPGAWAEVSPSGNGLHIVGTGTISKALAATPLSKTSAATVEIYGWERFLCTTGKLLPEATLEVQDVQLGVEKLLSYLKGDSTPDSSADSDDPEERPLSKLSALKIHADNLTALRQAKFGEGNELLNKFAFFASRAFHAGVFGEGETADSLKKTFFSIVTVEWRSPHPEGGARQSIESGWNAGKEQPLVIEDKWPQVTKMLEEFSKYFLVKNFGGKARVCQHREQIILTSGSPRKEYFFEPQTANDFKIGYQDELIKIGENAKGEPKYLDKASAWLKNPHKRKYERVVFEPGCETPGDVYNLWRGFAYPEKKGDCSLYLAHLRDNVCQGDSAHFNWLIRWMAWQVRHPGEVGQSAVVIHGVKGVGKNVAAEGFCELWGRHGMVVDNQRLVTGNFNAHLRDKCCLVCDEAFFAKDPHQVNQLKVLITGKTLKIEFKGVDVEHVPNLLRLIIIGNDDHIVHATGEERRFFVLKCGEGKRDDQAYFAAIDRQLKHGGYQALLYHLLREIDLTNFNVRKPLRTVELLRQMADSLQSPAEKVWFECLGVGMLPARTMRKDGRVELRVSDLVTWAKKQSSRWEVSENSLGNFLGDDPRAMRPPMNFKTERRGHETRFKIIPPLAECRKLWDQLRFPCEWPRVSGQEDLVGESWELREPE